MALSNAMRQAWVEFARNGTLAHWSPWNPETHPTRVLGPWPGDEGLEHQIDRPRDEELQAMAALLSSADTA